MQNQTEWTCFKCTAINQRENNTCWNCKTTIHQNEELKAGEINKKQLEKQLHSQEIEAARRIQSIPVVSIDLTASIPIGKYKIKGMVSAQAIKSTGFILGISNLSGAIGLDISSTKRTTSGETEVLNLLRAQAHQAGANAVIGTDLDFSDTGGFKSVLICAQGTAIFIENIEQYFDVTI